MSSALSSFQISTNRFFGVPLVSLRMAVRSPEGEMRRATIDSERSTGEESHNSLPLLFPGDKFGTLAC
jgi:hypothetical protein